MRRRRRVTARTVDQQLGLMNPLIDVVFLILIYFVLTFTIMDVIAQFDVAMPGPDPTAVPDAPPPVVIEVRVHAGGYSMNDKPVTIEEMYALLNWLGGIDSEQHVAVVCAHNSAHESLITALDACADAGLTNNLSVLTVR